MLLTIFNLVHRHRKKHQHTEHKSKTKMEIALQSRYQLGTIIPAMGATHEDITKKINTAKSFRDKLMKALKFPNIRRGTNLSNSESSWNRSLFMSTKLG